MLNIIDEMVPADEFSDKSSVHNDVKEIRLQNYCLALLKIIVGQSEGFQ